MDKGLPSFDHLLEIAQKDPAQLEAIRQREVNALIRNAPEEVQRRLRGLQFQIDCKRRLYSSPLGACIAISQMMLVSLEKLNNALQGEASETTSGGFNRESSARVLRFPSTAGQ